MNNRRIGRYAFAAAGAAAGIAAAGAGLWKLHEKRTEKPNFTLVDKDGEIELRDYPPLILAETVQVGTRERALGNGFGVLADYFFAETRDGPKVEMTAPVIAAPQAAATWAVRFVMPATFSRSTVPPTSPGVAIVEVPRRRVAAIVFAGRADDALLAAKAGALAAWIARRGLAPVGAVEHAFYNPPFVPGAMRTNEVWQVVE